MSAVERARARYTDVIVYSARACAFSATYTSASEHWLPGNFGQLRNAFWFFVHVFSGYKCSAVRSTCTKLEVMELGSGATFVKSQRLNVSCKDM